MLELKKNTLQQHPTHASPRIVTSKHWSDPWQRLTAPRQSGREGGEWQLPKGKKIKTSFRSGLVTNGVMVGKWWLGNGNEGMWPQLDWAVPFCDEIERTASAAGYKMEKWNWVLWESVRLYYYIYIFCSLQRFSHFPKVLSSQEARSETPLKPKTAIWAYKISPVFNHVRRMQTHIQSMGVTTFEPIPSPLAEAPLFVTRESSKHLPWRLRNWKNTWFTNITESWLRGFA